MTRIKLNELNEIMEEIPVKLMLIINAVNKDNVETYRLLRTLYNEFKDGNLKQYRESEQLIQAISNNANDIATAVKTGIKEMDLQKAEKRKLNKNVLNVRSKFLICGIIRYTLDGKHFWQYY